jgi:hypothetical protein
MATTAARCRLQPVRGVWPTLWQARRERATICWYRWMRKLDLVREFESKGPTYPQAGQRSSKAS